MTRGLRVTLVTLLRLVFFNQFNRWLCPKNTSRKRKDHGITWPFTYCAILCHCGLCTKYVDFISWPYFICLVHISCRSLYDNLSFSLWKCFPKRNYFGSFQISCKYNVPIQRNVICNLLLTQILIPFFRVPLEELWDLWLPLSFIG